MNPSPDDMSTLGRAPGWAPPIPPPRRSRGLIASIAAGVVVLIAATVVTTWLVVRPPSAPAGTRPATADSAPTPTWSSAFGTATAAGYPSPPAAYASADDLLEWLSKEGLGCTDTVEHVDNPSIATSLIDCGVDLSVAVYASHKDAVRGYEALNLGGLVAVYVAVGSNWTVNGDEAYVRLVVQRLGGEFHAT